MYVILAIISLLIYGFIVLSLLFSPTMLPLGLTCLLIVVLPVLNVIRKRV